MPSLSFDASESSARAPSPTTPEQRRAPTDDTEPLCFPNDGENHGLSINRIWVDTHASLLHTDRGLYVSVRGIKDADEPDRKRPRDDSLRMTRSKVARKDLEVDAATASHSAHDLYESQDDISDGVTTPDVEYVPDEEDEEDEEDGKDGKEFEGEISEEAIMDDRKPDISLIDLPHSRVVPTNYLWRQCAVFMEVKKDGRDGPLNTDSIKAQLPQGEPVGTSRAMMGCKTIITQIADNARILMATRPFLRFCLHITFCGTNFNLALFDRNGAIISRTYNFKTHLGLFIRVIRRLSCEMNAYDLGLDTTVRPEGCLGAVDYPSYLVKISDETWYRTEGVPLWQSTSLLGRGTLVFNAREHSEPNGMLHILKNAWREDGRLKESELYELMQDSDGPFKYPKTLAKFIVGGDIPLHKGAMVTIEGHRARFGSKLIGNGATIHRLVLASRGESLGSYNSFKQLLKAAWGIVVGKNFVYGFLADSFLIPLLAHKKLNCQGILHGDLSYGNMFLLEPAQDHVYGFLADLDLASIDDQALDKLPEHTVDLLKEQREKGPRSVG